MTEAYFLTNWPKEVSSDFIIIVLAVLNIILVCWAAMQKRRYNKLERDTLAEKTFGTATPVTSKQPFSKLNKTENVISQVGPLLKIDQAIKMVRNGYSLEETKAEIDIEAAYLQIISKHHHNT
jgi:hypothetical protein